MNWTPPLPLGLLTTLTPSLYLAPSLRPCRSEWAFSELKLASVLDQTALLLAEPYLHTCAFPPPLQVARPHLDPYLLSGKLFLTAQAWQITTFTEHPLWASSVLTLQPPCTATAIYHLLNYHKLGHREGKGFAGCPRTHSKGEEAELEGPQHFLLQAVFSKFCPQHTLYLHYLPPPHPSTPREHVAESAHLE